MENIPALSLALSCLLTLNTVKGQGNVIAAVTNDLREWLKVKVCTVSTFYSDSQNSSTAGLLLH